MNTIVEVISPEKLLSHWQGHRNLTRKVIEAFPEKDFFEFSIGGMRSFSALTSELLAMGAPGMKGIVEKQETPFQENSQELTTKEQYLEKWDQATEEINQYWSKLQVEDFNETVNLFGHYNFPVIENILYIIDNEIHHRGQGYVYLRALGIQPPFFWER
ncbi:putative damage-inducible protein DinB [Pedobacter sp. CAN_A7]|uniref:DinB family protein n=1 Tax=Pedobacter sp. CAN_A7 TaxID=2787722 RepID=UPI0018C935E7